MHFIHNIQFHKTKRANKSNKNRIQTETEYATVLSVFLFRFLLLFFFLSLGLTTHIGIIINQRLRLHGRHMYMSLAVTRFFSPSPPESSIYFFHVLRVRKWKMIRRRIEKAPNVRKILKCMFPRFEVRIERQAIWDNFRRKLNSGVQGTVGIARYGGHRAHPRLLSFQHYQLKYTTVLRYDNIF